VATALATKGVDVSEGPEQRKRVLAVMMALAIALAAVAWAGCGDDDNSGTDQSIERAASQRRLAEARRGGRA